MQEKNNFFRLGQNEKVQDTFICWCINWFNDYSKPALKQMATEFVKKLSGVKEVKSVSFKVQTHSIDILLKVNGNVFVIIEDKVDSKEHDNQIERYKKTIENLINNPDREDYPEGSVVRTVYFKTRFFFDDDIYVRNHVVDFCFDAPGFLEFLTPYIGKSEILDSYAENLKANLEWHAKLETYVTDPDNFWDWNIANYAHTQYKLMREFFPEELWVKELENDSWDFHVYDGRNQNGHHWTQCRVKDPVKRPGTDDEIYKFFWRIDTDEDGPYISLRLYEDIEKNDDARKERHRNTYDHYLSVVREIVEENQDKFGYRWDEVKNKQYKGRRKESELVHVYLREALKDWDAQKDKVIYFVTGFTEILRNKIQEGI